MSSDLTPILQEWPFTPGELIAREIKTAAGEPVIQLRLDLGILQMRLRGRPDGEQPEGFATMLACLKSRVNHTAKRKKKVESDEEGPISDGDWQELDREIVQFYHRRLCLLTIGSQAQLEGDSHRAKQRFEAAVEDSNHTLACMDFVLEHAADDDYVAEHEQYRPYVLWHRGFANSQIAMANEDVDQAIEALKKTESDIREVYQEHGSGEEEIENDAQVQAVRQLIKHLRREHKVELTLEEQLNAAIAAEKYELAAIIRDQIRSTGRRQTKK